MSDNDLYINKMCREITCLKRLLKENEITNDDLDKELNNCKSRIKLLESQLNQKMEIVKKLEEKIDNLNQMIDFNFNENNSIKEENIQLKKEKEKMFDRDEMITVLKHLDSITDKYKTIKHKYMVLKRSFVDIFVEEE